MNHKNLFHLNILLHIESIGRMYKFTFSGFSSVLTNNYFPPIELKGKYVARLVNFSVYNSIPNVDNSNNYIKIGQHVIRVPRGSYEISDLTNYIQGVLKKNNSSIVFELNPNVNTQKSEIFSNQPIFFDEPNNLAKLLGFKKRGYVQNVKHESEQIVDIMSVNQIKVTCDIVTNSYNNSKLDQSLHTFPILVPPAYKISETPRNSIYLPVNTDEISSITCRIEDQNGNLVNFSDEITLNIYLMPVSSL